MVCKWGHLKIQMRMSALERINRNTRHIDIFTCTLHRCSKSFLRSRAVQEYSLRGDLLSGYGKSDIQCSFVGLFTSVFHGCSKSFSVADKPVHKSFANAKQCTKQCPQECWHQLSSLVGSLRSLCGVPAESRGVRSRPRRRRTPRTWRKSVYFLTQSPAAGVDSAGYTVLNL